MKNKKILFVCQYFYPEKVSSGILPYELAKKLAENNYNVNAMVGYPKEYVSRKGKSLKEEIFNNINIKRLSYIQANRKKSLGRIINMISFSVSVFFHPKLFKKTDVIISFTNPPLLPFVVALYSKIFKKKFVMVIYDLYPDSPIKLGFLNETGFVAKSFNFLNNIAFKQATKIIAVSSEMKEYLIENKNLDKAKIEVIHNWYNDDFSQYSYSVKLPIKILYGGNMGLAQDMKTIINTALLLKNDNRFEFIFAGHGSKKEEISNFIEKNQMKNCVLYDFLEKEKYDCLLESCHLTILSLNKEILGLGSPSKYYGYLALKKPVIAIMPKNTDIYQDIIKNDIGIHVNSGEANLLTEKLIYMVNHIDQMKLMSDNAYKLFKEQYTLEKSTEKYISILKEI